jgi:hypothetical protein
MRTGSNFVLFAFFFFFLSCLNVYAHFCFGFCLLCVCGRYFVSFSFLLLSFVWILVSLNWGWVYGLLHEMKAALAEYFVGYKSVRGRETISSTCNYPNIFRTPTCADHGLSLALKRFDHRTSLDSAEEEKMDI